jgi:hypothetical protein
MEASAGVRRRGVVRRARAGVGVVAAATPKPGAAVAGPPRHGVPLPGRRCAADGAAQPGGQVPAAAAGLPRRRAQGDATVPSGHEGARYVRACFFLFRTRLMLLVAAAGASEFLRRLYKRSRISLCLLDWNSPHPPDGARCLKGSVPEYFR